MYTNAWFQCILIEKALSHEQNETSQQFDISARKGKQFVYIGRW